jgi:hypothetical protein
VNIIVAGIMGRYPYAGVGWCSLQYLLGLQAAGHEVWYLEDTGECNIDPVANTIATDPAYAVELIRGNLARFGFEGRWCYVDYQGGYHGCDAEHWRRVCAGADLFLNLSGGCWFWRDEYRAIPHRAFIDSDPAFTQLAIAQAVGWYVEFFRGFDTLFTFGANIGTAASPVPTAGWRWEHTWQPVCLDQWTPLPGRPRRLLTTVMTWQIESFTDIGGNKDQEFAKVIDLPRSSPVPLEVALSGTATARRLLELHGWRWRDAFGVSRTLGAYRRYIATSLGEFSVAKHTYVATNSGWFSDRSECYLASGRPVVVQDTGFGAHLPTGDGLLAFTTAEEALAGVEAVASDPVGHGQAARALAREHFAADVVLPSLVERATGRSGAVPLGVSS